MNKSRKLTYIIWIIILALVFLAISFFSTAHAAPTNQCPPPQFVRGYDKTTGAVVCGQVTGCPYGDSIPLGPECDKLAPVTLPSTDAGAQSPVSNTPDTTANDTELGGK